MKIAVESCDLSDGLKKTGTPRQAISFKELVGSVRIHSGKLT